MSVNISSIQLLHDVLSFRFSHACPQRYLFDSAPTPNAHALHKLTDFGARCQLKGHRRLHLQSVGHQPQEVVRSAECIATNKQARFHR